MTQGESEHVSKLEEHGIRVVDGYPKRKICFDTIKKICHELKTHNYDICYAFNSKTIPNAPCSYGPPGSQQRKQQEHHPAGSLQPLRR